MNLFLRPNPILNRYPPVKCFSPYAGAGRSLAARLPSGQGVRREPQLACELLPTDPVGEKVQRLMGRIRVGLFHGLLR